jgi:transposase
LFKWSAGNGFTAFRQGITQADPSIRQIYDRFHFIRNAKKQLDTCTASIVPAKITWSDSTDAAEEVPLTRAEKLTSDRQKLKWELVQEIQEAFKQGKNLSRLAREYDLDWRTIQKYTKMNGPPHFQRQRSRLTDPFNDRMRKLEKEGNTVKEIYSALQIEGYTGTYSGVRTFVQNIRKDRKHNTSGEKVLSISRRSLCAWLWQLPEKLNKEETEYLQRSLKDYPALESVYQTIQQYRTVVEARDVEGFLQWLRDQLSSRERPSYYYAFRLRSDIQAVKNALTLPFSNGLLEGQINRLKTIKRLTYGRAGLTVLEKRILYQL